MSATVVGLHISKTKGVIKKPVDFIQCKVDHGVVGDAHAGDWHRQISLLAIESYAKMEDKGLSLKLGSFAENITTQGLTLYELPIGQQFTIGEVLLEVTQIGKVCHQGCAISQQVGDCVMPREGIFAIVLKEGTIHRNDEIVLL